MLRSKVFRNIDPRLSQSKSDGQMKLTRKFENLGKSGTW